MNTKYLAITENPSLRNSIIRLTGLELVWSNSESDEIDLSEKYLELTKEFSREDAIAFQHNSQDCWSVYAMQDYTLLSVAQERYIFKHNDNFLDHEIDTDSLQHCFTCKEYVEESALRAYKIIAGEEFRAEDAIAFYNLYGERTYEMQSYIVVICANNPVPAMDGVWIYRKQQSTATAS